MLTVTIDDVMKFGPCGSYPRERVADLFGGRERVTALDVLSAPIPATHRLWLVLRPQLVDEPTLHELACRFAEAALETERAAGREPDPRSWAAIGAKRDWLAGKITVSELVAAWDAAWAVANASTNASERSAAIAAAWAVANASTNASPWASPWVAASDAAWATESVSARDAARDAQIEIVRDSIGRATGEGKGDR